MRKVGRVFLWIYVFTLPWDVTALSLPGMGAASRLAGLLAVGTTVFVTAVEGRWRKPDMILGFATLFAVLSALSLLWTVSYDPTLERVVTYTQLVASVWVIRELVRTPEQQRLLLLPYCLGAFIPLVSILNNFRNGVRIRAMPGRFTATGFNADDVSLLLVIGIPIAWHLMMRKGPIRMIGLTYVALAPVAVLLTATRGAFLAGLIALSIIPLSLPRQSLRSYFLVALTLIGLGATIWTVVPQRTWTRIMSIQDEMRGGNMTGRVSIWRAGWQVFPEHALLGVGAGAYGPAVQSILNTPNTVSHNTLFGLLVEHGIVGLSVFVALLGACVSTTLRLPPADRKLWAVLLLTWLVGVMSLNWEWRKVTWLLFGLLAAQSTPGMAAARTSAVHRRLVYDDAQENEIPSQWGDARVQG